MPSAVALVPAAKPEEALAHFERRLRLEADCWNTHYALTEQEQDFVLLDAYSGVIRPPIPISSGQ